MTPNIISGLTEHHPTLEDFFREQRGEIGEMDGVGAVHDCSPLAIDQHGSLFPRLQCSDERLRERTVSMQFYLQMCTATRKFGMSQKMRPIQAA